MDEAITCKQYTGEISDDLWEKIEPLIADAAEYSRGEFTPATTRLQLFQQLQQLWVVTRNEEIAFVWVTEIRQQTARRIVVVYAAAGKMTYGWEFWPHMSQWMRGNNIQEAEVYCRPAMARLLRRRGLKTRYEVLTIDPDGGIE